MFKNTKNKCRLHCFQYLPCAVFRVSSQRRRGKMNSLSCDAIESHAEQSYTLTSHIPRTVISSRFLKKGKHHFATPAPARFSPHPQERDCATSPKKNRLFRPKLPFNQMRRGAKAKISLLIIFFTPYSQTTKTLPTPTTDPFFRQIRAFPP